jgi:hypothetical protein
MPALEGIRALVLSALLMVERAVLDMVRQQALEHSWAWVEFQEPAMLRQLARLG